MPFCFAATLEQGQCQAGTQGCWSWGSLLLPRPVSWGRDAGPRCNGFWSPVLRGMRLPHTVQFPPRWLLSGVTGPLPLPQASPLFVFLPCALKESSGKALAPCGPLGSHLPSPQGEERFLSCRHCSSLGVATCQGQRCGQWLGQLELKRTEEYLKSWRKMPEHPRCLLRHAGGFPGVAPLLGQGRFRGLNKGTLGDPARAMQAAQPPSTQLSAPVPPTALACSLWL